MMSHSACDSGLLKSFIFGFLLGFGLLSATNEDLATLDLGLTHLSKLSPKNSLGSSFYFYFLIPIKVNNIIDKSLSSKTMKNTSEQLICYRKIVFIIQFGCDKL